MRRAALLLVLLVACGASDRRPIPGAQLMPSIGATRVGSFIPAPAPTTSTSTTTSSVPPPTSPPHTSPPQRAGRGRTAPGTLLGTFRVTCYGPPQFPPGDTTASGRPVGPSSIAVDPAVIPLGTWVELEGIGPRRADDTGGKVDGYHVDLWRSSCAGWPNPRVRIWTR